MEKKEILRNKFFMDCTYMNDGNPKVDMTPHNLFEWIWKNFPHPQEVSDSDIDGTQLAILFHQTYERLAPKFGYVTRAKTKKFSVNSPNGRLMVAVCEELLKKGLSNNQQKEYCTCINRQDQFERGDKCICGDCENEIKQPNQQKEQVTDVICDTCKTKKQRCYVDVCNNCD